MSWSRRSCRIGSWRLHVKLWAISPSGDNGEVCSLTGTSVTMVTEVCSLTGTSSYIKFMQFPFVSMEGAVFMAHSSSNW